MIISNNNVILYMYNCNEYIFDLNDENRQARKDAEEGNFAHTFKSEEKFSKFMNEL